MSIQTIKLGAAALLTGALLVGQAQAQQAAPAAPAAGAPPAQGAAPPQPQDPTKPVNIAMQTLPGTEWLKVCGAPAPGQKETCFTTRDFTTEPNVPPPVAVAVYDVKGEDSRVVRVLLPIGLLLKPGVRVSADKGAAVEGAFQFCMPNGCFAEARVTGKQLDGVKKAQTLNIVAKGLANNEVTFSLPLSNFGQKFDGAAVPVAELQKRQQQQEADLQKQLQERAAAQRAALEKAANAGPAPVMPTASGTAPAKP